MNLKLHYRLHHGPKSKPSALFSRRLFAGGAIAILALTAVAMCAGFADAHQLPSVASTVDFTSIASLGAMPVLGSMLAPRALRFLDKDSGGGGGGEGKAYEPKDEFEKAVLGAQKNFQKLLEKQDTDVGELKKAYGEITEKLLAFQKNQIAMKGRSLGIVRAGHVSDDAARHCGAIALVLALKQEQLSGKSVDLAEGQIKEILGAECKAALTTSEIPLPVEYSGEVVELVSKYGTARRYGTVYPLGAASVKLPKLTSSPAFGLIAMSGTVTEKAPAIGFVTFNAEKFGGLIRLPSEIDEDSIVAMGQFLARYSAREMAKVEDLNFWAGTGADSGSHGAVKGLAFNVIDNAKVVQMAATKTKYSDATLSNFRAIRAIPDEAALGMSAYYLHPTFEVLLNSFNTAGDRPFNPNAQIAGVGANPNTTGPTLDGFPIVWINSLPAYSTSNNVSKVFALFGDVSYEYLGVRGGMRFATSEHAGFTTDEILVRALERFTIGLMADGAVAGLETAAS